MLIYPLYYDIISLTSLKIIQVFHLLLGFAENSIVSWYFKIQNSIRITEGSDNGDSDNQVSIVVSCIPIVAILYAFMLHVYTCIVCCNFVCSGMENCFAKCQISNKSDQIKSIMCWLLLFIDYLGIC